MYVSKKTGRGPLKEEGWQVSSSCSLTLIIIARDVQHTDQLTADCLFCVFSRQKSTL